MFWSSNKEDHTQASIAQPPPTPGLASWAFNSLFNRQTPSSKYANLKNPPKLSIPSNTPRRVPQRFNDDTLLTMSNRKNVAWGGEDFKLRSRSSSFSERPQPKRFVDDDGSIHYKDSKYFKDNELLPDDPDDETDYRSRHRYENINTERYDKSRSNGVNTTQDYLQNEKYGKSSLPQTYPGKYPSPYVHKNSSFDDLLSSSAVKNFQKARSNTKLNQFMKEEEPMLNSIPRRKRIPIKEPKVELLGKEKNNRAIMRDEQSLLDSIDQNIMELDNITSHINGLKLNNSSNNELERKYKEIRQELITELKKSKKLYDSYYQFVNKYRVLKNKYKDNSLEDVDSMITIKNLQKQNAYLKEENDLLNHKLKSKETKYLENDSTINDLKSTLNNSSKFEVTLRRKIKYLEDKIEKDQDVFKQEKYLLNEKIYMMETRSRDDEELFKSRLSNANDRIRELEQQLEQKSSIPKNLSIIPEYTNGYNKKRYQENDDTIHQFEEKYPDRKPLRPSPEKRYNMENMANNIRKRPTSLSPDFQRDHQHLFKNFDNESTNLFKNNHRSNSLRSIPTRDNLKYPKRYSNPSIPDLTFNSSEIG